MKTIVWTILALFLFVLPAKATPVVGDSTNCQGSWDGPGWTACELLSLSGIVGLQGMPFNPYSANSVFLMGITAHEDGFLEVLPDGKFRYTNNFWSFDSEHNSIQFAVFHKEGTPFWDIGIEDLPPDGPNDWDYNDSM